MIQRVLIALSFVIATVTHSLGSTPASDKLDGWKMTAPRDEIRPHFKCLSNHGPGNTCSYVIRTDEREGLHGAWTKTFSITGGKHYRFRVLRKTEGVPMPRRSALAKITWQDDKGRLVKNDNPTNQKWLRSGTSTHRPDYPLDRGTKNGWTELSDIYKAPTGATKAVVELFFRWAPPNSRVAWNDVSLKDVPEPAKRIVRLASVHLRPRSEERTAEGNCKVYAPYVAEAAAKKADLVVLGETITIYGTGLSYAEAAEPIPGPSSRYFSGLAQKHDLHIIVGLLEKARHLIYNVAILIGPDGKIIGKYRKTCLPRGEADGGVSPGNEFPVFQTEFGKVGMMVCYDAFFPEVARQLTINGAEVIALPVWGCNPELASARATENSVYLVSSTFTDHNQNWIKTAIFNHEGEMIQQAKKWGEVVIAEVDLNRRNHWHGTGDFKARINRGRPNWVVERQGR
ncbi:MAG: carbon-nitrogen hydrolase family protein [Verrucomicrobiales bacterium]|nr:carbon-nitrogen hydrolase family protein [Verrucomicrobiales bacterium]|tara:strand:- start:5411 stop:6778 length:1368 start_codon:yes stop_codon:yes gene_type:complete